VLVGFAAETDDLAANALDKLRRKNLDFIVANDVSAPGVGFEHDTNAVTIFCADGSQTAVALAEKSAIAGAVLDQAQRLLQPD
jgi:phosphopantothenoylcysteine decarboxylase/phosphopantothenate--cysteine ligase